MVLWKTWEAGIPFYLSDEQDEALNLRPFKPFPYMTGYNCEEIHLLIVEDDLDDHLLLQDIFIRMNWMKHVRILKNAQELFQYLDVLPGPAVYPSLIVIDYNIPRTSGQELLLKLKSHPRYHSIPVSIYSTCLTHEKEQVLLSYGACTCRNKPLTLESFHHLVDEFVNMARLHAKPASV